MSYSIKVNTKYFYDGTGCFISLPAIATENGLLITHLRYLYENRFKSPSWREKSIQAVLLLLEYMNANSEYFTKASELLRAFVGAMFSGTVSTESLIDDSGLYWRPRSLHDATALLNHINQFTDYIADTNQSIVNAVNPWKTANTAEMRLKIAAYHNRNSKIFLNYLNNIKHSNIDKIRSLRMPYLPVYSVGEAKRFPDNKFDELLTNGFIRKAYSDRIPDYGSQAIVMLMHYGGIRKSEVFHLYLSDISIDQENMAAVVRIFHPSMGESPEPERYRNRREFLSRRYHLTPRNELPRNKRLHSGWKNPLLTNKKNFFVVHFFPPDKATEFLYVWIKYLKYQRIDAPDDFMHPYAFTNSIGHPETIKNYQRLYANAIKRIGLNPQKRLGTTEHGHRHAYGYRLADREANRILIQKAMHHKNPESSATYTSPTDSEIRDAFKKLENL